MRQHTMSVRMASFHWGRPLTIAAMLLEKLR